VHFSEEGFYQAPGFGGIRRTLTAASISRTPVCDHSSVGTATISRVVIARDRDGSRCDRSGSSAGIVRQKPAGHDRGEGALFIQVHKRRSLYLEKLKILTKGLRFPKAVWGSVVSQTVLQTSQTAVQTSTIVDGRQPYPIETSATPRFLSKVAFFPWFTAYVSGAFARKIPLYSGEI
jgi:hypothetical protein